MLIKMHKKNEKGFTLIELMIVIAIIGILAAIAIPQFAAYRIRSYNASAQSDVRNCNTSEAAFYADWLFYGRSEASTVAACGGGFGNGARVTGPSDGTNAVITGTDNANTARGLDIGLGRQIDLVAHTNAAAGTTLDGATCTIGGKHAQGDTCYGVDSDLTTVFQDANLVAVGTQMVAGDIPASTANDDFTGQDDWVAK